MLDIFETDFRSLENFPLKWRWTDERWNLLPLEFLRQINPVTEIKAKEINEVHIRYFFHYGLNEEFFEKIKTIQAELEDSYAIGKWLKSKIYDEQKHIFVSWDQKSAVRTTPEIFCTYWDDFCYPSSDDVTVSSVNLNWILFYHHEEYFNFGKVKKELL